MVRDCHHTKSAISYEKTTFVTWKQRKTTRTRNTIGMCESMIEPKLNMDEFLADLDDGMSAYDLQDKYILTPRQYRKIMRNIIRKDGYNTKKSRVKAYTPRSKFHEPHITLKKDGKYLVRRHSIYYGQYDTLEIARKIKQKLIVQR